MNQFYYICRGTLQSWLAYRSFALSHLASNLLYLLVIYFLWQSIYQNNESINGMSFEHTLLYLIIATILLNLFRTWTGFHMSEQIRSGEIVNYLLKPIEHIYYTFSVSMGVVLLNILLIVLPSLILTAFFFKVFPELEFKLLLFIPSIIMGYLIAFLLDYITGIISFYTESIWGVDITKETLQTTLSGAVIPFSFFPDALKNILIWTPFPAIFHTPISFLVHTPDNISYSTALTSQLIWVIGLFVFCKIFFYKGIQKITINGG